MRLKKIIYLTALFLFLIIPVIGVGEYQRYTILRDLKWSIKDKEVGNSSSPDINFAWIPEQNKVVLGFPLMVENSADIDAIFSRVVFDVSIWGLESGGGEISQHHIVPVGGSKTLWINNFEANVNDFDNFVFTLSNTNNPQVDIDILITTYYPFFGLEFESGHSSISSHYPLDRDQVEMVVNKKLEPFIGV